jgi:hypothetical protein
VLEPVLEHALETLAGPFEHAGWPGAATTGSDPGGPGAVGGQGTGG